GAYRACVTIVIGFSALVFMAPPTTELFPLSLHDALPISPQASVADWIEGARLRTLPAAIAPVAAGTGVAAAIDAVVWWKAALARSEEHTSELQSRFDLVCRLLLEKTNKANPPPVDPLRVQ